MASIFTCLAPCGVRLVPPLLRSDCQLEIRHFFKIWHCFISSSKSFLNDHVIKLNKKKLFILIL
ncbi:hypothetical protein C2G38_2082584 [Gigaspora rosea]|uniref:Uncharacterized protein n=1 Tax=Gigaspora rosea TaxID=44941 RepID=A0A397VAY9_9GLOM|nr:hypothetical protein C2G38_2082584 [Gigaspora rosea]